MKWCCSCGLQVPAAPCPACGGEVLRDAYGRVARRRAPRAGSFVTRAALVATVVSLGAGAAVVTGWAAPDRWLGTSSAAAGPLPGADAFGPVGGARPRPRPSASPSAAAPRRDADTRYPRRPGRPPPGVEVADGPLGTPVPPPPGTESYSFLETQPESEEPVTWDPCRPLHYVTTGSAPLAARRALTEGMQEVARITGLRIVHDGPTSEQPSLSRKPYQPGRYGERWAPVLVSWSDPSRSPDLAGGVIGYAQNRSVKGHQGRKTYVSGSIVLDEPFFAGLAATGKPRRLALMRAIAMHEMNHVLGLGHVYEADQIMYPEAQLRVHDLGDGDRRGLYKLSTGPCAPDV